MSIADELEKLSKLHSSGVITSDEFETQKKNLLSGVSPQDNTIVNKKKVSTYRMSKKKKLFILFSIVFLVFIFFAWENSQPWYYHSAKYYSNHIKQAKKVLHYCGKKDPMGLARSIIKWKPGTRSSHHGPNGNCANAFVGFMRGEKRILSKRY